MHQGLASKYGVRGYPTIKYFAQGTKKDAEEYDGGRTTADITQWALSRFEENLPAPEVTQICVCCRTDSFSRYFLLIWKEFFDGFSSLCDVYRCIRDYSPLATGIDFL